MAPALDVVRRFPGWIVLDNGYEVYGGGFHSTYQRAVAYAEHLSGARDLTDWITAYDRLPGLRRLAIELEHEMIRSQQLGDSGSNFQALNQKIIDTQTEIERLEAFIKREPIDENVEVVIESGS